jgi:hypothetical protein
MRPLASRTVSRELCADTIAQGQMAIHRNIMCFITNTTTNHAGNPFEKNAHFLVLLRNKSWLPCEVALYSLGE